MAGTQARRFRQIPLRTLVPNVITLLALCAGLTGIRLALEGRLELALGAIVFAAMLDAVDGRVARMIKGTTRFGAELDSLADFFNFGVAPGLILYFWGLKELGNLGWIAAMVFAICAALRLARFNVQIEDPNRRTGPATSSPASRRRPAPSRCCCRSISASCRCERAGARHADLYLGVAGLMVSRLPVLSGKKMGTRVRPDLVLPVILVVVLWIALLVSYPWHLLSVGTLAYLALLPLGWFSYQRHYRRGGGCGRRGIRAGRAGLAAAARAAGDERPARLN